ncbi:MAG: hypothetical protein LBS93_00285, partial [Synergistaceae bacterium]|nr:hypothetical protein [Synergistaceae bacterium]
MFDERKREKLMGAYYELASLERRACRVLSALYAPIAATKLARVLNAVSDKNLPGGVRWDARKNLAPFLEKGEELGIVQKISKSNVFWTCNRLISEPLAREALSLGEFGQFCAVFGEQPDLSGTTRSWRDYHFDDRAFFMRELRKAVYLGDEELFAKLVDEGCFLNHGEFSQYLTRDIPKCPPFIEILFNPLDEGTVMSLPSSIAVPAIDDALNFFTSSPNEFRAVRSLLANYTRANPGDPNLTREEALHLIDEGRTGEAEDLLASCANCDQGEAIKAFIAVANGSPDEALALFDAGMKRIRKKTGKRKIAFSVWCGVLYPILMLRSGAPAKKISDYTEAAASLGADALASYAAIDILAAQGAERQMIFSDETLQYIENPVNVRDVFFITLFSYWIDPERTRKYLGASAAACRKMMELGMNFLASELASLMRDLSPGDAVGSSSLPEPAHPIKNLLRRKYDWELSLGALSQLAKPQRSGSTGMKRLVWRLDWKTGRDKRSERFEITPIEQVLQTRGWSAGKDISLSRLHKNPDTVSSLTEIDRAALTAIREEKAFYGHHIVYIDAERMLSLLAGHPLLFRGSTGEGVEIVVDEPRLSAASSGGSYILKIDPYPSDQEYEVKTVIFEDSHNCLRLVPFEEKHLKMARVLGREGLVVPESARDSVLKTLGGLASVVTVHSDIAGVESGADVVEPNSRLYVQLQPSGDGLDAEAVTRPLGSGSAPCRPGIGGPNIFGLKNGRRVQTRRDMTAEADALAMLIGSCRALSDAEQTSENRWALADAELSLEFLLQLGDVPDVVVEWPKGGDRSVTSVGPSSMSLSVRGSRDWFSVSGEIKVDDGLVWNMKQIVRLLDASKGRFIPIGGNRFIALTEDFRRRLEDLSSVGDLRGDELRISPLSLAALSPMADEVGSFEGGEWRASVGLIDEASAMNPEPPSTFAGELRGYQLDGFRWLARLAHWGAGACLADDMGLGKTIQALALLLSRGPEGPALVVAPTSVCPNWVEEASRFAPTLKVAELRSGDREAIVNSLDAMDVLVASYGLLQSEQQLLCGVQWRTIVLDEAQAIKNMGTKRSAAAMKL